jgi:hypothetical protein
LRGTLQPNCLPRSLTKWWLLRRQGIPCDLRIGVRSGAGEDPRDRMQAHAWVEIPDVAASDAQDYTAFDRPIMPDEAAPPSSGVEPNSEA